MGRRQPGAGTARTPPGHTVARADRVGTAKPSAGARVLLAVVPAPLAGAFDDGMPPLGGAEHAPGARGLYARHLDEALDQERSPASPALAALHTSRVAAGIYSLAVPWARRWAFDRGGRRKSLESPAHHGTPPRHPAPRPPAHGRHPAVRSRRTGAPRQEHPAPSADHGHRCVHPPVPGPSSGRARTPRRNAHGAQPGLIHLSPTGGLRCAISPIFSTGSAWGSY